MGDDIPVTFEYKGTQYRGILSGVKGGGADASRHFHLMVDNFYWGQLHFYENPERWSFTSNTMVGAESYSEYFGQVVMAYYQ